MTTDLAMVKPTKETLGPYLPSILTSIVLEFANWENFERKQQWIKHYIFIRQTALEPNVDLNLLYSVIPYTCYELGFFSLNENGSERHASIKHRAPPVQKKAPARRLRLPPIILV